MGFIGKPSFFHIGNVNAPKSEINKKRINIEENSGDKGKQAEKNSGLKGLANYGKALVGKSKVVKTSGLKPEDIQQMSPEEKQAKLDKAGFTEEVIAELKQKSTFYGPRLVEEALNMAIYLDAEYDAGAEITEKLLDSTIDKFSPGASGGSASSQMGMLAQTWVHGDEIYKAFGETPPIKTKEIENLPPEEKQAKLDKAGFTEEVIADIKSLSGFYGPELVDEALNMVIYLDAEYDKGTKITKQMLDDVIDAFSPGASGGSAACQRAFIAERWEHGDKIYEAYGQTPPIRAKKIENLPQEEKQAKLDKAGFTEDVIQTLKEKSTFYGPELVDEALNMAIYLDAEHDKGTKITKQLLDDVIDAFSPGASGGSAYTQLAILSQHWTHGKIIEKVYK